MPKVDSTSTKTLWVDKAHYLVYREDSTIKMTMPGSTAPTESKSRTTFESVAVDQPVAPDTFTFTPPAGATEMDLSSMMPKTPAAKP